MKLLVLGGTRFLGRHLVDAALARGDDVTVFTRGKQPNPWGARSPRLTATAIRRSRPGSTALASGTWDAVVDTSGYVPRVVRASAELLAPRVRSLSVRIVDLGVHRCEPAGTQRDAIRGRARGSRDRGDRQVLRSAQGGVRARRDRGVRRARASTCGRGSSSGPHDPTDRFGYWVARFVHPQLARRRARRSAVVPQPPSRPVQFIDARDLAAFMLELLDKGLEGTYNATSPAGQWTFGDLVDALLAAGGAAAPRPHGSTRRSCSSTRSSRGPGCRCGFRSRSPTRRASCRSTARRRSAPGLRTRPLAQTIADTAAWLAQRDNAGAWKDVLSADAERRDSRGQRPS